MRRPHTITVPISGTTPCAVGDHITRSGNITVTETESPTAYGFITFLISDPTNNLNDCAVAAFHRAARAS